MIRLAARLLTLLSLAIIAGCAAPVPDTPHPGVTIMTFNVENLFDSVDDPGRNDATYLPVAAKQDPAHIAACNEIEVERWRNDCLYLDWSEAAIDYKLRVVADAIRQVGDGAGPDVIALQEVENRAILERLRTEYLGDLDYGPSILIEGQDRRGIDVAFLSRLDIVGEPVLHPLTFPDFPEREGDTRGVLEATFALPDGGRLTGYSVHFPAPFHPTAMRIRAYEHLNRLRESVPDDHYVFAGGDFNTTSSELAETDLFARYVRPYWTIAHEVGCEDCPGTHYYARDGRWSFLDMILFSPARSEKTTWQIRAKSVALANETAAQVKPDGTPQRFDIEGPAGVSDHWPLVVTIERTQKQ